MKRAILQTVIGGAMAVSASAAMAFDPATTTPDYTIFISGSSAVSNPIRDYVAHQICDQTADVSVFRRHGPAYNGTNKYGDDWGVACRVTNGAPISGLTRNANVLFLKRDAGGSGYGVMPVIAPNYTTTAGTPLGNLPVIQVGVGVNSCAKDTAASSGSYNEYDCGDANETDLFPDAGLSDVEPDKFRGQNAPPGFPDYGSAPGYSISKEAVAALTFGIPVSTNLRDALQAAQFPASSVCSPLNAGYTAHEEDADCMPSLTATQIRALYAGGIESWNNFMVHSTVGDPTSAAVSLPSFISTLITNNPGNAILSTLMPSDNNVEICRRTPGSGTQATLGIEFLNSPCDANAAPPFDAPGDFFGSLVVEDGAGGKDMGLCLDAYSNGLKQDGFNANGYDGTTSTTHYYRWAAGLQFTTENSNAVSPRYGYRFIKIDGYAPDVRNVAAGNYPYYSEESYQYRTDTTTLACTTTTHLPCAGNATQTNNQADIATILSFIGGNAVTPAALGAINANVSTYPWGHGGWLAIPGVGGAAPSYPLDLTQPVNTSTRAPFGHSPNTCQPPMEVRAYVTGEPTPTGP